jgi:hypothetical protein
LTEQKGKLFDYKSHKEEHKSHRYFLGLEPFLSTCFVAFVVFFVSFVVNHVSPLAHARGVALINRFGG